MRFALRFSLALSCLVVQAAGRAADIAIVGAKVYPAPDAQPIADAVVLVRGDRILAVGSRSRVKVPNGFRVINGAHEVVTAGFWNCHVHLIPFGLLHPDHLANSAMSATLAKMFTRWGFTTVFDLASTTTSAKEIRNRIESGAVEGPHILTVGEPFYPPGGTPVYALPIYRDEHLSSAEISSPSEAASRVVEQARQGVNGIKLFTGAIVGGKPDVLYMSADAIRAITSQAHRLGLQTFSHPTDPDGANLAIDNGVDILAHTDPLGGPWSPAFVQKLRSRKIALIPTLTLFAASPNPRTPVATALLQLKAQAQSGGDVIFGTDAGFTSIYDPTEEYRLMGRVLTWQAVLASLTTTPARRFGQADRAGKVEPGYVADLVLLGADPSASVSNLARVRRVILRGRLVYDEGRAQSPS